MIFFRQVFNFNFTDVIMLIIKCPKIFVVCVHGLVYEKIHEHVLRLSAGGKMGHLANKPKGSMLNLIPIYNVKSLNLK